MNRGRLFWGVVLIVVGALLLVNTTGRLPWLFWTYTITYWPALIVGAGLAVLFPRAAAILMILSLAAMFVLGYLTSTGFIPAPW
ncbi:MAG TPA: hypothetical protein GX507_10920 [Clostridia bacterium]|nr:hypothetical protein [Clostridia bacterium]